MFTGRHFMSFDFTSLRHRQVTERAIGKVDLNVEARQNSSIPHTAGRDDFALDGLGPGYRQIQLRADGRSDTHVMQLEP